MSVWRLVTFEMKRTNRHRHRQTHTSYSICVVQRTSNLKKNRKEKSNRNFGSDISSTPDVKLLLPWLCLPETRLIKRGEQCEEQFVIKAPSVLKSKAVFVLTRHDMKTYGVMEMMFHAFISLALHRRVVSFMLQEFFAQERAPGIYSTRDCVGSRIDMNAVTKRRKRSRNRTPAVHHFNDRDMSALQLSPEILSSENAKSYEVNLIRPLDNSSHRKSAPACLTLGLCLTEANKS